MSGELTVHWALREIWDTLAAFGLDEKVKAEVMMRELASHFLLPEPYYEELREGRPIRDVLLSVSNAARLGQPLETSIRTILNLPWFGVDENRTQIDYSGNDFILTAATGMKKYLDEIELRRKSGSITLTCRKFVSETRRRGLSLKPKVDKAISDLSKERPFGGEYTLTYMDPENLGIWTLELMLIVKGLEDLPRIDYIAKQFGNILRSARRVSDLS